jgi:hypothetical protein
VKKFAEAEGVELNVATGTEVMDMVIKNFLEPENRSILLNPINMYSSVAVCEHHTYTNLAIQNFAEKSKANELGTARIEKLMKEDGYIDSCNVSANDNLLMER